MDTQTDVLHTRTVPGQSNATKASVFPLQSYSHATPHHTVLLQAWVAVEVGAVQKFMPGENVVSGSLFLSGNIGV